jgi:cold shock CspA family protein
MRDRKYSCSACAESMRHNAMAAHICIAALVKKFCVLLEIPVQEVREQIALHQVRNLPMDDSAVEAALITYKKSAATPLSNARRIGRIVRWVLDKRNKLCGFVELSVDDGGAAVFLHSDAIKLGVAAVDKVVSFRVEPSPIGNGRRQAYDAVVLEDEDDVGTVVVQAGGFALQFSRGTTPLASTDLPQQMAYGKWVGMEAVRSTTGHRTNLQFISTRHAPVPDATAQPPPGVAPLVSRPTMVTVVWDFADYSTRCHNDIQRVYLSLVDRLVDNDSTLARDKIFATAVSSHFQPGAVDALSLLGVQVKLVSRLTNEDMSELKRLVSSVAKNPLQSTTDIVLISNRNEVAQEIRHLEVRNFKVLLVHNAVQGSSDARRLERLASSSIHLSGLLASQPPLQHRAATANHHAAFKTPPRAAAAHPVPPAAPAARRPDRLSGTLANWDANKNVGHVRTPGGDVFLHGSKVTHGTPTVGCKLSLRDDVSKEAGKRQAYDAVVLGPNEVVGTLTAWGLADKHNMTYGFAASEGATGHFVPATSLVKGTATVGAEILFTVAPSVKGTQATGVTVLSCRGAFDNTVTARSNIAPSACAAAASPTGRLSGTLKWDAVKGFGFAADVFVHANGVIRGAPADGCMISYRDRPNAVKPDKRQAYDVVVLSPGEMVGMISRWGLNDVAGKVYGFITAGAVDHFLHETCVVQGTPVVGAEFVFTAAQGLRGPQARAAVVLSART